jgi:hypothetical protein
MKLLRNLIVIMIFLATASLVEAGEKNELRLDGSSGFQLLRTRFADYGSRPPQSMLREKNGVLFALPKGSTTQTGVYSLFVLAGDCEVSLTYDLLNLPSPSTGTGSGIGLTFDLGEAVGYGVIKRVSTHKEGGGYALQTKWKQGGQDDDQHRFVPSTAKRGTMGLKREKNELIFLASDDPTGELREIARLPFPSRAVRSVKLFADTGGAEVPIQARLSQVKFKAEELTGGVPRSERKSFLGWWLGGASAVVLGLVYGYRRATRQES